MAADTEKRGYARRALNCAFLLTFEDAAGEAKSLEAQGVNISESGAQLDGPEDIPVGTVVGLRVGEYGFHGKALIRHCRRRGSEYRLGVEFVAETHKGPPSEVEEFVDFYELLQISPSAQEETIHRVYRILAARYHPDNPETGDNEKFLLLRQAYETLDDPGRRLAYDSLYRLRQNEALPVFELKEFLEGVDGEMNRRMGILCLLYGRRRMDPDDPGLSILEFETLMALPREHLLFTIWFLKELGHVRMEQNADYSISAEGVLFVEANLPSNRLLYKLLGAPRREGAND